MEDDPRLAESELEQVVAQEVARDAEEWTAVAAAVASRLGCHCLHTTVAVEHTAVGHRAVEPVEHTAAAHTAEVEFVHTAAEAASFDYCILPDEVDSLIAGRTRIAAEDRTEAAAEQIEADPVYATSGRAR